MKYTKKRVIILIVITLLLLIGAYLTNLSNSISEYYSTSWVSKSISDSKLNKRFVRELQIFPKKIKNENITLEFNQCWIEEQTKLKYSWLFFEESIGTGKYRLCFNLMEKFPDRNALNYFFVNDNGKSFAINSSGNDEVFNSVIDINASGKIKVSLVKSFREPKDNYSTISLE